MTYLMRKLMAHGGYLAPEGGEGGSSGGGSGGSGGEPGSQQQQGGGGGTSQPEGGLSAEEAKKLADEKADLLKEVMTKKEKIKSLETTAAQLQEQLKKFDGINPDEVRALLQQRQEEERKKLEEKGNFEALKAQMVEAHQKEKEQLENTLKSANDTVSALQRQIADLTVGNAFGNSAYIKNELILTPTKARVVYGSHFEFQDGQVVAYDKPAGSQNRTMLVDGKGDPLGFDAALQKIVEADADKDTVLKSKSKPGAGSGTTQTGKTTPPANDTQLTGRDKIAAGLAKMRR